MRSIKGKWCMTPMIGEIKNNNVIILLEPTDKVSNLLYSVDNNFPEMLSVESEGPTKAHIYFENEGKYNIKWHQLDEIIYEHDIIIDNDIGKIIFVSCDLYEAESRNSMWDVINQNISHDKLTSIFHLGDQSYMDKVFKDSLNYVRKYGRNVDSQKHIIETFGKRYYQTWIPHHEVLSKTANYYIWDDHEIKNDMSLEDDVSDDADFVRSCAITAYSIYQESNHYQMDQILSSYSWYKYMGKRKEILSIAIERTSTLIPIDNILSSIKEKASTSIKKLILCFSCVPLPGPVGNYGRLYRWYANDNKGHSKFWPMEWVQTLYSNLFDWLDEEYDREVLIVGGDLHLGYHGVAHRGTKEINIIISSPITNQPTLARWMASKGLKDQYITHDERPIFLETKSCRARRCFAEVDISKTPMDVNMYYSNDYLPKNCFKYLKYVCNH